VGRFETRWLAASDNLSALVELSGQWIDRVYSRRPPRGIVLDMDSSVSPTQRTIDKRLERPLRMHLRSSAVRLQPVRRPRCMIGESLAYYRRAVDMAALSSVGQSAHLFPNTLPSRFSARKRSLSYSGRASTT
jgi:hypothetical protein